MAFELERIANADALEKKLKAAGFPVAFVKM